MGLLKYFNNSSTSSSIISNTLSILDMISTVDDIVNVITGNNSNTEAIIHKAHESARTAVETFLAYSTTSTSAITSDIVSDVAYKGAANYLDSLSTSTANCNQFSDANLSNLFSEFSSPRKSVKDLEEILKIVAFNGAQNGLGYINNNIDTKSIRELLLYSNNEFKRMYTNEINNNLSTMLLNNTEYILQWLCGEMPTHRCLLILGEQCLSYVSELSNSSSIENIVGNYIGDILTSGFKYGLQKLQKRELEYQLRELIIIKYNQATESERIYREHLESYIKDYLTQYRTFFDCALNEIDNAFAQGDANGIIHGANSITNQLGGKNRYNTVDEFIIFCNNNNTDIF